MAEEGVGCQQEREGTPEKLAGNIIWRELGYLPEVKGGEAGGEGDGVNCTVAH